VSAQPSTTPRVRDTWRELATWIQAQFAGPWRDLPLVRNPEMGERPLPRHVLYPHLLAANASRQLVDLSNRYGVSSETAGWRIVAEFRPETWMLEVNAEAPDGRRYSIVDLANGRVPT
jgi:hypothetical protein